jgi:hypothetical protein
VRGGCFLLQAQALDFNPGDLRAAGANDIFLSSALCGQARQFTLSNVATFAYPRHLGINLAQGVTRSHCEFFGFALFRLQAFQPGSQLCDFMAQVEGTCLFMAKRVFQFSKVRYRGIAKNANRLFVACALANLYIARRQLMSRQAV